MNLSRLSYFYLFALHVFCSVISAQNILGLDEAFGYRISLINESGYHWLNNTPLNRNNKIVPQIQYNSNTGLDLFFSWKFITIDTKGETNFTDRDGPAYDFLARELYFDYPVNEHFHLTIGRKIMKWGSGYAFNPTGVVEPNKSAVDPSDRLNRNKGRQLIAFDFFWGNNSLTFIYANEARYDDAFRWGDDETALHFYTLLGDVDLSVVAHLWEKHKTRVGFNTAYTYGSHIELHSEFIVQQGSDQLYHQVLDSAHTQTYFDNNPYRARFKESQMLFYKLSVGAQYTFNSGLTLMTEYYYNREGLTYKEWQRWRQFTLFHQRQIEATPSDLRSFFNFYSALKTLHDKGVMRHYGFFRGYYPLYKSGLELMALTNIIDASGVSICTYNYYFSSILSSWLRAAYFWGENNSEYGILFSQAMIHIGIKVSL